MHNLESRKRHFQNFRIQVENIWQCFCLWDEMQSSQHKNTVEKNYVFWRIVFLSIQDELILNLHEIFKENKDTLNVYTLYSQIDSNQKKLREDLKNILCKNYRIKTKFEKWRHNLIAHKSKRIINKEIKDLGVEYKVMSGLIESPIDNLFEILEKTQEYFMGDKCNWKEIKESAKTNVIKEFKQIVES